MLLETEDFVFLNVVYDDYVEPTDSVITREHHFELLLNAIILEKIIQIWTFFQRRLLPSVFSKRHFP